MPMTKQMQIGVLSAIGGAIALFAVIQFVMVPMAASRKDNLENILALREQLDKSGEILGRGPELQKNLFLTRADICALATNIPLPVLGNYLLGMEQQIQSGCAGLNIKIVNVAEYDVVDLAAWNKLFKAYRVRVVAQAGINDLARCFAILQRRNPLTSVQAINIAPLETNPEMNNVSFVLAWLIWADPDRRPAYLQEQEKKTSTPGRPPAKTGPAPRIKRR